MESCDIVLFSPPSRMLNHYRPPVSLLYLAGYLTNHQIKARIIDTPVKEQIRDHKFFVHYEDIISGIRSKMMEEFKKIKTELVGVTCYSTEFDEVLQLIQDIKSVAPHVKIIVGGIHPTFIPMDFFEVKSGVDICVMGEGEVTLYELVSRLRKDPRAPLDDIKGLIYKDPLTGLVKKTPERDLVENLDDISKPDYSLIDTEYYTNASPYSVRGCYLRSMYVLATRGCPSQCTFCVAKKIRECAGKGNPIRIRSAESLICELRELKAKYAIDGFYFIDDMFTINKKNVHEFCERLKEEKLNLLWGCSSKVSTLDESIISAMAKSGCVQIDFGVERGSDEALNLLKKGITVKKIIEIFDLCRAYGVRTLANILVNAPGETQKDLDDILKLLDRIRAEVVYLNIFLPFPGTEIYEKAPFKFSRQDYSLLTRDSKFLIENYPEKFKFAQHSVDLAKWQAENYGKYNSFFRNIIFYLRPQYWKILIFSRNKMNYLKQFYLLIREFINQKFHFGKT